MTAVVRVQTKSNDMIRARASLDTCATAHFITEEFAKKLQLPLTPCSISIGAINSMNTTSKFSIKLTIKSLYNEFEKTLTFFTVPEITNRTPDNPFPRHSISIPPHINLADPNFQTPGGIDLLIGSGATLSLFSIGQINLSTTHHDLHLQKTLLGWTIVGEAPITRSNHNARCHMLKLDEQLEKFWKSEELPMTQMRSADEIECENHFKKTTTRAPDGRYIVRLPFREPAQALGDSRSMAVRRLHALEKRLNSDENLKTAYASVIQEYRDLGHMSAVDDPLDDGNYLPHHAVIKNASETTKVRVVFDASAKSKSGVSLNELLLVGPTIQYKIFTHLIRFRMHKFLIMADIEKMYRQVLMHPDDRKFLRIVWRVDGSIKTFQLNTVTFGVASAPFQAIRTVIQLAQDHATEFPTAAKILLRDLYVDNLLTGADTVDELIKIREEITQLCDRGGFNMREWASNSDRALLDAPAQILHKNFSSCDNATLNTLGVAWDAGSDQIMYTVNPPPSRPKVTKRFILSEIAKLFDPLGLFGPIILRSKIIMQELWKLKIGWDESVPSNLHTSWSAFAEELGLIDNFKIERRLLIDNPTNIEIHGFCDASQVGYGAAIYVRSKNRQGKIMCRLCCAKSRVAPLKTITIPRAELCASTLLAKLYEETRDAWDFAPQQIIFWSDSTITLSWIKTSPHLLKIFVANRVSEIQSLTATCQWRHVRSEQNPADALSRGQNPSEFLNNTLWFDGPSWLLRDEGDWPRGGEQLKGELPETRGNLCLLTQTGKARTNELVDIVAGFSSYSRAIRIIAYCVRFYRACQKKVDPTLHTQNTCKDYNVIELTIKNSTYQINSVSIDERNKAEVRMLKIIQASQFSKEIELLSKATLTSGNLISLGPFFDDEGLIRVGGRLRNASITFSHKYPILLPSRHHITKLIIKEIHEVNYHAGIQTSLGLMRHKFWLIDGRQQIRSVIRKCVTCFRVNPTPVEFKMGNLPRSRLENARPFFNTGIDFCGPIFIKENKFRNLKRIKAYICVFVCMSTRAIHLEVVSDLSTEGFLGAFKTFAARRGLPANVHSDNGTNFVGANNELQAVYALMQSETFKSEIVNFAVNKNIRWHFIPPLSPHFGGIWEAAVKVFKHHFKRVVGEKMFTFVEVRTLTAEIEAILNSRPICALSSDPNDRSALTPAHFLIGQPMTMLPDTDLIHVPENRLSSWRLIAQAIQHFWKRWQAEYLHELQKRKKWNKDADNLEVGTIVLIKDKGLPPTQWALGRVIEVHPGEDGIVRAATVKTTKTELKRCVNMFCPLPINHNTL